MTHHEITEYLDTIPFLEKNVIQVSNGTIFYYNVNSKTYYDEDKLQRDKLPDGNSAKAIVSVPSGIICRNIRIMNGLMWAREAVEVSSMEELKNYIGKVTKTVNRFSKMSKDYKEKYKLKKIKEDFK